jgi:hypothetical protein
LENKSGGKSSGIGRDVAAVPNRNFNISLMSCRSYNEDWTMTDLSQTTLEFAEQVRADPSNVARLPNTERREEAIDGSQKALRTKSKSIGLVSRVCSSCPIELCLGDVRPCLAENSNGHDSDWVPLDRRPLRPITGRKQRFRSFGGHRLYDLILSHRKSVCLLRVSAT